jgi:hypothetical protein
MEIAIAKVKKEKKKGKTQMNQKIQVGSGKS